MEVVGSSASPQEWLQQAVGVPCQLVRQQPGSRRSSLGPALSMDQAVQNLQPPEQSRNTLGTPIPPLRGNLVLSFEHQQ